MKALPFPLPPLAEQKRIVARVDQLMALIDDLEQKQIRKRQLGANFTKASLEALTGAESPEEFDTAWKRVVENWGVVVDRVEKVLTLRKAIVSLALRGRLVAQDPSEGTSEQLLKQMSREKLSIRYADDEELPTLPRSWRWVHLSSLVTFGPKNGYSPKAVEYETKVKSLTLSATTSGTFDGQYYKYLDENIPDDSAWEYHRLCRSSGSLSRPGKHIHLP
jgi:type I restriction enzyme S subunit